MLLIVLIILHIVIALVLPLRWSAIRDEFHGELERRLRKELAGAYASIPADVAEVMKRERQQIEQAPPGNPGSRRPGWSSANRPPASAPVWNRGKMKAIPVIAEDDLAPLPVAMPEPAVPKARTAKVRSRPGWEIPGNSSGPRSTVAPTTGAGSVLTPVDENDDSPTGPGGTGGPTPGPDAGSGTAPGGDDGSGGGVPAPAGPPMV